MKSKEDSRSAKARKPLKSGKLANVKSSSKKSEDIPPELENFVRQIQGLTPVELIQRVLPDANARSLEGLAAGATPKSTAKIPKWAIKASRCMWASTNMNFLKDVDTKTSSVLGKVVETGRSAPKDELGKMGVDFESFFNFIDSQVIKAPAKELKKFAEGRIEASENLTKLDQLSQRANIYALISIKWEEVEKLNSASEVFSWLLSNNSEGNQLVSPRTDSREIRAICQKIGLKFKNHGGRPRKKPLA